VLCAALGPASYGLGTADYELNIIKDCFGVERLPITRAAFTFVERKYLSDTLYQHILLHFQVL
jgi:hypothetical protein